MASSAYKNKTGLPFLFSFCLIFFYFFHKLSENVGEAAEEAEEVLRSLSGPRDLIEMLIGLVIGFFFKSSV